MQPAGIFGGCHGSPLESTDLILPSVYDPQGLGTTWSLLHSLTRGSGSLLLQQASLQGLRKQTPSIQYIFSQHMI